VKKIANIAEIAKNAEIETTNSEPNFTMGESDKRGLENCFQFGISGDPGNIGNLALTFPRVNYFATPLRGG
jgi:hypothetical protein